MGNNSSDDDSFGGVMPQAAVDIPTAVGGYLTHGDNGRGIETRVVEGYQTNARDGRESG
ncbi:hypothetical protein GCM10009819_00490 [Agromyces tropicus]|uniref:Uncharacterized protein n=1 Tax=Agromyces tropicus TaxID=555371 RepID=A0ABN2TUP3_9MICO